MKDQLDNIFSDHSLLPSHWMDWNGDQFIVSSKPPTPNRETLARIFSACAEKFGSAALAREVWNEQIVYKIPKSLPGIIGQDTFLAMYVLNKPLKVKEFKALWGTPLPTYTETNPIFIEWNANYGKMFDVDATPPGMMAKLFTFFRLKADQRQLEEVQSDLREIANIENQEKRLFLTLAVLSHSAAYRELQEKILHIPSFENTGELIPYRCHRHLIAEGVKTLSLVPETAGAKCIYLCQGTEIWPSQPSVMGSILANFATHGSATEAYAHSWRRIHKHLRDLNHPIVCGHSMGGALAIQIGLYSHELIHSAYAFNPPMPNRRNYDFYHQMSQDLKEKIHITANIDDFAFWRIGEKLLGKITIYLGKKRWRYFPVNFWDAVLIFPAFIKFILNVWHAFPAHQTVMALKEQYVYFDLTQKEIERENQERTTRFDYLSFFPRLYDPMKTIVMLIRRVFRWKFEEEFIENEIEIIALHERDLIDTLTEENKAEIENQLEELKRQKLLLKKQLARINGKKLERRDYTISEK